MSVFATISTVFNCMAAGFALGLGLTSLKENHLWWGTGVQFALAGMNIGLVIARIAK